MSARDVQVDLLAFRKRGRGRGGWLQGMPWGADRRDATSYAQGPKFHFAARSRARARPPGSRWLPEDQHVIRPSPPLSAPHRLRGTQGARLSTPVPRCQVLPAGRHTAFLNRGSWGSNPAGRTT